MSIKHTLHVLTRALALAGVLSLAACGGGGDGSGGTGASSDDGLIGGTGIKGPVDNATVTAYSISDGAMGPQIGTATTNAGGSFSMSIGSYSGPVMLQLSGGTFVDEATGTTMPMALGDVMTAALPTVAAGSTINGISLTPVTSMAQTMARHMSGGLTDANIAAANTAMGTYFSVSDILHVQPVNPLVTGSANGATQDAVNYGMAMAAMSQYAKSLGTSSSSAIVTAMMNDASDGRMNGMMGSGWVMMGGMGMGGNTMSAYAGTSGLASALLTFLTSSQNKSGVTVSMMQTMMDRLSGSSGQISGSTSSPAVKSTVSGTVFSGPMQQATVVAFAVANGAPGAQVGSTTTDAQGNFTIPMGTYAGPVMLQASSGTYTDLATGTTMRMAAGDVLTAVMTTIASGANVTGVMVTPLTSMAWARAQTLTGGLTDPNIAAANAAVGNYCMVSDILRLVPMNTLVTGAATTATQDSKYYGACIAAMSQYAKSLGLPVSSTFMTDMMYDAADGMMNGQYRGTWISMPMGGGMMGGSWPNVLQATAGTSGLATAMLTFMNSDANLAGLTVDDMAALMQKLTSSSGQLQ